MKIKPVEPHIFPVLGQEGIVEVELESVTRVFEDKINELVEAVNELQKSPVSMLGCICGHDGTHSACPVHKMPGGSYWDNHQFITKATSNTDTLPEEKECEHSWSRFPSGNRSVCLNCGIIAFGKDQEKHKIGHITWDPKYKDTKYILPSKGVKGEMYGVTVDEEYLDGKLVEPKDQPHEHKWESDHPSNVEIRYNEFSIIKGKGYYFSRCSCGAFMGEPKNNKELNSSEGE